MLAPHEIEILRLVAEGYDTVESISEILNLSPYDTYEILESLTARGYLVKEWKGFIVKKPRYRLTSKGLEVLGVSKEKREKIQRPEVKPIITPPILPTLSKILLWSGILLFMTGIITLMLTPFLSNIGKVTGQGGVTIWIFPFPPITLTGTVGTAVGIAAIVIMVIMMLFILKFLMKVLR